jgi:hypothetical protein
MGYCKKRKKIESTGLVKRLISQELDDPVPYIWHQSTRIEIFFRMS